MMNRTNYLVFAAIAIVSVLAIATSGILSVNNQANPQNTPSPTPPINPTSNPSPSPTSSPTPLPSQPIIANPTITPVPLPTPTSSPPPLSGPDPTLIQNITLRANQQYENGTVTMWILSGDLVDNTTNLGVSNVTVTVVNGSDNTIIYTNCTTNANGAFQGTVQADPQMTSVQIVFAGDGQYQACITDQIITLQD